MTDDNEDHGKIFWPIAEGDCPNIDDAYATLYSLSDAKLWLSFYDETGNTITNELTVEFQDIYEEEKGIYARKPLKELITVALDIYDDDDNSLQVDKLERILQILEEP